MGDFFSLEDRVAVITGGSSGIGLSTAKRFHQAGAKIIIASRGRGQKALQEIGGGDYVKTDVSVESQVEELMEMTGKKYGEIDILVNCAGINEGYNALSNSSSKDFMRNFGVNTMGVVHGIKHSTPYMRRGGAIVNIASVAGVSGVPNLGPYVASKWAVIGITKTAALELGERNIRVNAICPTSVDTPMAHARGGERQHAVERLAVPLQRIARPEEIAALIHFLAAPDCGFVNGQAINVDGGFSAGLSIPAFNTLSKA
ncbi:SDR family NAD(P)-dependent oxidoreductase [Microbulbifer sp. GL-2]|uniref:SDR family NAD(P)-dependent oxidoreductase n=1 Tax=Microbulbifer sp. GL-2 TaxID=2591606 RepID=UPI0011652169|nr:SDR family oxidoreductase [Microbulbifer sp. GL-2]BBM03511.1 short chain dehydrogenase [Microbulbifer sp. GL-2]